MSAAPKAKCPGGAGQVAEQKTYTLIVPTAQNLSKQIATLQAQFALCGHILQLQKTDECTTYVVSRWGQSRHFAHLNDVQAFLTQVAGSAA
jgi:hypothetical protein